MRPFYFFRPANALHTAITAANSTPATGHMTQLSRQEWPGRLHARYTAAATHQYTTLRSKGGVTQYFRFDIM